MTKFLNGLFGCFANNATQEGDLSSIRPDRTFTVVGDIHGRLDLLNAILTTLDSSNIQPIIFLGDYVDRGPHSADVLKTLFKLQTTCPDNVICLMGNHERMMLDFLDDPLGRGARWLRNGGIETVASFGISALSEKLDPDTAIAQSDALGRAMPEGLIDWMRNLPKHWHSGNIWCVHAGMDPRASPTTQKSGALLWGHKDFALIERVDDAIVVHGHTIVPLPQFTRGRIAIDTGAYRTGALTVAQIGPQRCDFVTVSERKHMSNSFQHSKLTICKTARR